MTRPAWPERRGRWQRPLVLSGWVAVVALVTVGLHHSGGGELAAPPVGDPGVWATWVNARDPVVAAVALLRVVALAAAWYLLVASIIGTVLRLVHARRLVSLADRVTIPALRRLLVATAGITLAAGFVPGPALAHSPHPPAVVTSTAHLLVTTAAPDASPTVTMHLLPPEAVVAPAPGPPGTEVVGATWTVEPGQCFWTIAEQVLAETWGRAVTDAEIVPYWRALIEQNRSRLGDPSNPDLIFPTQVFALPPPPPKAA